MGLIPAGAMPHVKRFGWSGLLALGVVIVMLAGINPITLISGKVFDRTKPEEPTSLQVGGVIPGWTEALKLMKTGDTWELVIPSDLAYGSDGVADRIPADQTLVFLVNLAKVEYAP